MTPKPVGPVSGTAAGGDLEYDLSHEDVRGQDSHGVIPGDHDDSVVGSSVSTETPSYSGDYGYDLAHDIPKA